MRILWICLAFASVACVTSFNSDEDGWYDDYWYEDMLDKPVFDENEKDISNIAVSDEKDDDDLKKELSDFIDKQTSKTKSIVTTEHNFEEYQFEDNRSVVNEDTLDAKSTISDQSENDNHAFLKTTSADFKSNTDAVTSQTNITTAINENHGVSSTEKDLQGTTKIYSDEDIIEETKAILNEDTGNDFAEIKSDTKIEENDEDLKKIFDETNKILDNDDTDSIDEEFKDKNSNESFEYIDKGSPETAEDDTVDKAFNDLMSDLDKLKETWNKLKDSDDVSEADFDIGLDSKTNKLLSLEDDDYEEINDNNLEKIFENNESDNDGSFDVDENDEVIDNQSPEESELKQTTIKLNEPILYLNDALSASEAENKEDNINEELLRTSTTHEGKESETQETILNSTTAIDAKEELSSAEVDELMQDFTERYQQKMQISLSDVKKATQIQLNVDTPVVITSPGFPEPYPTNQTTDWMFTGNGMGIELNITEFAVNGHVGDYLLVKPGGVDESGSTGLLFSYRLNSPRRYRFLDVDQMFMRFEAKQGMQVLRGFNISARMVVPRLGAPVPEPEPEPVIPVPPATITLNLAGLTLDEFIRIEESFREIIADMATMYINRNGINPGINTTLEMTQITSKALCYHNWPKFERCAEVRFGIPLVYENVTEEEEARLNENDLREMWDFYSKRDPFVVRLRMLGITEYQVPNERGVLTVWLVIAGGVVISMSMLAFALWRFSCFATYTRMPSFNDTDSLHEKRKLDLYPTPHQTLPPLYSETDYKWADSKYDDSTKGGYSNKSYMHNDLFNIDSDEEVLPARDRSSGISPRDIYSV
ncbi:unnamed protein product, partial [Brenthis ino]